MQALYFKAAGTVGEIGLSLKPNFQNQVKLVQIRDTLCRSDKNNWNSSLHCLESLDINVAAHSIWLHYLSVVGLDKREIDFISTFQWSKAKTLFSFYSNN